MDCEDGKGIEKGGKRKSYPPLFFLLAVSAVGKKKYGADRRGGREDEEAAGSGKMRKEGGGGFSFSFFPWVPPWEKERPSPLISHLFTCFQVCSFLHFFSPPPPSIISHTPSSPIPPLFFSQAAARRSLGGPGPRAWRGWPGYETKKASTESAFDWRVYLTFLFIFFARTGAEAPRRRPL